jgi:hypothetical protein
MTSFYWWPKPLNNKVIHKVKKRWHGNPLFGHIGDEMFKNGKKITLGFNRA